MAEKLNWEQLHLDRFQKGSREIGIFELAELFGISSETLRKYESKLVLRPHRGENGYRKYSSWELTKIIRIRQLLKEGFLLQDVARELNQEDPLRPVRELKEIRQQLEREILFRERLIRWIDTWQDELLQMEKLGDGCALERQERWHCCVYMVSDTLVSKSRQEWEHLKEWMQAIPFVHVCYVGRSSEDMVSCLALWESELERYGLTHLIPDFVLPEQLCTVCNAVAERSHDRDTSPESIVLARRRAEELGRPLADYGFFQMVRYTQQGELFRSYNKAIFAVQD